MRFACAVFLSMTCLVARPARAAAEVPSKSEPPVSALERSKTSDGEKRLQARAPVAGEPFDDREVELYFEAEAQRLWAAGHIAALRFENRSCGLAVASPAAEKLSGPALAARAEAATLVIGEFSREGKKKDVVFSVAGGAFAITPDGACLTSLHVAREKGARGFCAMTRNGQVFPVREVLAFDPLHDLAILQLALPENVALPTLPLAAEPAPIGTPTFVLSHPDNRFFLLTAGHVARHTIWRTDEGDEAFMAITADFAKGSSGCPVLDERGAVIGIVNNTESIYYEDDGPRKQTDLQMVVKNATPSWAVRAMLTARP